MATHKPNYQDDFFFFNEILLLTSEHIHRVNDQWNATLPQTSWPMNSEHDTAEVVVVGAKVCGKACSHRAAPWHGNQAPLVRVKDLLTPLPLATQNLGKEILYTVIHSEQRVQRT